MTTAGGRVGLDDLVEVFVRLFVLLSTLFFFHSLSYEESKRHCRHCVHVMVANFVAAGRILEQGQPDLPFLSAPPSSSCPSISLTLFALGGCGGTEAGQGCFLRRSAGPAATFVPRWSGW